MGDTESKKECGLKLLIIDDEPQIRRLIQVAFEARGFTILQAEDGQSGVTSCALNHPDIVILDLGLPGIDGQEVIRRIREWTKVPIIVLSVRDQDDDKVAALDSGADDYVTKPFSMPELLARVRVAIRHHDNSENLPVVTLGGDLFIDRTERRVTRGNRDIRLTPTEYALLTTLAAHPGRVMTHNYLLRSVWGPGYEKEMRYLRVYIAQLRQKLEANSSEPRYILTEPGVGYRTCDS